MSELSPLPDTPLGLYRHYKGGEYEVLGVARHSETHEPLVVYRPLSNATGWWVRPHAMFFEVVEVDGERRAASGGRDLRRSAECDVGGWPWRTQWAPCTYDRVAVQDAAPSIKVVCRMPTFVYEKSVDASVLTLDFAALRAANQKIIYLLWDPRPSDLRCYIGQTNTIERFRGHYKNPAAPGYDGSSTAKKEWVADLHSLAIQFNVSLLEHCSGDVVDEREQYWIGVYEESQYHIVCNGTVDRANACAIFGELSSGLLHPKKPGFVCRIDSLDECGTAGRLLRTKRVVPTNELPELNCHNRSYWRRTLSPTAFQVMEWGVMGHYSEKRLGTAGDHGLKIRLAPWLTDGSRWR